MKMERTINRKRTEVIIVSEKKEETKNKDILVEELYFYRSTQRKTYE